MPLLPPGPTRNPPPDANAPGISRSLALGTGVPASGALAATNLAVDAPDADADGTSPSYYNCRNHFGRGHSRPSRVLNMDAWVEVRVESS